MESAIQLIKRKAITLIEQKIARTGRVLAVRTWAPAAIIEADLHLPGVNMARWSHVQHMKCRVGDWAYRDYSPCGWDAGTETCTLIIDAGHEGAGVRWAATLQPGDTVTYAGIASTPHRPVSDAHLVLLGDESAIGHFYALRQLAVNSLSIRGAVAFANASQLDASGEYFCDFSTLEPVAGQDRHSGEALVQWAAGQQFHRDTVFYLVGHIPMVTRLRQWLRGKGYSGAQIKAQGFWK
ncbi:SIP domain-containing protein [Chitinophaga japonensis]|uniref:FAD-binding FR-type domain-containing protein n=1 Tax=Chitinophaga japonensis TaxID=104662 RepID=A0A562TFN0_CHIJA|nr:hypothetical protein [Chitinophaga japonensis]TWI92341.1 hypothetical protein LX66_1727 [Chitinophaga japonensis]